MKKFLYILLWVLTVLNLAFCAFLLVYAISMLGETNAAGVVLSAESFLSCTTLFLWELPLLRRVCRL